MQPADDFLDIMETLEQQLNVGGSFPNVHPVWISNDDPSTYESLIILNSIYFNIAGILDMELISMNE